jgi:predicted regulator of Ras-like GTPase activity (Roadblock/LC7/MglB family)
MRPSDPTVQEALRVLGTRQDIVEHGLSSSADPTFSDDPWAASDGAPTFMLEPAAPPEPAEADADTGRATAPARPAPAEPTPRPQPAVPLAGLVPLDPSQLFDDLLNAGPLLGALLVDVKGLVLAGRLTDAVRGDPAVLGAVLGGAIGEAVRTTLHLALGEWRDILLDAEHALLHLAPAGADAVMVLAARRDAPAGWMQRASAHAIGQAQQYMEEYA